MKTGVENEIFWSEIGSGFGEPGGTPPTENSQEYPGYFLCILFTQSTRLNLYIEIESKRCFQIQQKIAQRSAIGFLFPNRIVSG